MSSIVLDLQQEVLKPDCDILNALRKAHLISVKLQLAEFDAWIMSELNGYDNNQGNIPDYRKVNGELKAWNPYYGWIPVVFQDTKYQKLLCIREMGNSISDIIELYNNSGGHVVMSYPGDVQKTIDEICSSPFPTNYALHISTHLLKSIIDKVGNCLLEWTIRLESEGILGENMRFSQEEQNMAKDMPQQINNYYGTVVNGTVSQSQVVSGNHNTITFNYESIADLMKKVRDSIEHEQLSDEDKDSAIELVMEVENKIGSKKESGNYQSCTNWIKRFFDSWRCKCYSCTDCTIFADAVMLVL